MTGLTPWLVALLALIALASYAVLSARRKKSESPYRIVAVEREKR